jgi:hypothetical protein
MHRAIVGLDHDEYGIEHAVLSGHDGGVCRLQHLYVYPGGEPHEEYGLTLTGAPA